MTNLDRAEAILTARHHKDQMEGDGAVGCFDAAAAVAELHAAGLLTPGPQIIRTLEELAALDPGTLLESNGAYNRAFEAKHPQWIAAQGRRVGRGWLPAVVIATGEQVRAARQALKEEA